MHFACIFLNFLSCPLQNLSISPKIHTVFCVFWFGLVLFCFVFNFARICIPKRCTRVQCLVLKNNPNYVKLFVCFFFFVFVFVFLPEDDVRLQIQVSPPPAPHSSLANPICQERQNEEKSSRFLPFLPDFSSFSPRFFLIVSLFFPIFGKFLAVRGGTLPP